MLDVKAVLAHVVLGHPQRQRHIAAKHHRVVLAVAQHGRVLHQRQLGVQADFAADQMGRILIGKQPEQDGRHQHDASVDRGHQLPAADGDDAGGHQLGERGTGITGPEHPHGHALLFRLEPARHIGRAHRKRTAGQAHQQADGQKLPIGGGVLHDENEGHADQHQHKQHDATAKTVGPDAQRHAHQRAGQHRRGGQDAEFGFVQPQMLLDGNTQHGKHHPDHETDGEGSGAGSQYRILLEA